jgi:K+-transporting ATPase ATPase C chain
MNTVLKPAIALFAVLTLVTGIAYPVLVTAIGAATMPAQARGSLVERDGHVVGSRLIGQNFSSPRYFWGRLSATGTHPYNGSASGGSNLGPLNPALLDNAKARIDALRAADPGNTQPIPVDLVTASASGLDPEISPAAAQYQARRVANARGLPLASVQSLVAAHTQGRQWGVFGEPRVNVLMLNLALDDLR